MEKLVKWICILTFIPTICLTFFFWRSYTIWRDCTGHLKRAADANTIPIAEKELDITVKFLEKHHITEGSTSILLETPENDIGFWYQNLKASLNELNELPENASPFEKTNVLMKLRETLLDHDSVTCPTEIQYYNNYPLNRSLFIVCGISGVVFLCCLVIILLVKYDSHSRY